MAFSLFTPFHHEGLLIGVTLLLPPSAREIGGLPHRDVSSGVFPHHGLMTCGLPITRPPN